MKIRWALAAVLAMGAVAGAKEATNKPYAGSTAPPLGGEEAQKRFKLPAGFEARLFAMEPEVINPVAMSFDEKGRLWVVELFEYPDGAKPGAKGRDRVKVYEDTNGDGKADKITLFCDGLSLATAVLPGNGGVYVGQAPNLYFYPIVSDGPDGPKAGERQTLLTGFGMDDRHELLNSFCWGPDGWLYFTQGVFTHSLVKDPANPNDPGLKLDAGVFRYNTKTRKIERFADGVSNQWGVDWDREGNAFVSACVVDHIWHTAPGGVYKRQGGTSNVPFTYEQLGPINTDKHRHYMAAYGGINVYQGNLFPAEYQGTVFMGNIHGNCLDHDSLTPDGASFAARDMRKASDEGEWLEANDDWFRPVSEQVGPDGALWLMDWYDKYPCYQNSHAPDLDRERGRIWRIVYTGDDKGKAIPTRPAGMDLGKMSGEELVGMLSHANIWQRRVAERMLVERKERPVAAIKELMSGGKSFEGRMAALWTLGAMGELDDGLLDKLAGDSQRAVRMWAARFTGERGMWDGKSMARLTQLAADKEAPVRAEVAHAVRRIGAADPMPVVKVLLAQPGMEKDPILPFMIWMAAEGKVAEEPKGVLDGLRGELDAPAAPVFVKKVFHRIADTKDPKKLDEAVAFLRSLKASESAIAMAAMEGILESKQPTAPAGAFEDVLTRFGTGDKELSSRAARLASLWGNAAAANKLLKSIDDPKVSEEDRLRGVHIAAEVKGDEARRALLGALAMKGSDGFKREVISALGEVGGGPEVGEAILKEWGGLSVDSRRSAAQVMAGRLPWAKKLLEAIRAKKALTTDVPLTAHRAMSRHRDEEFTALMNSTIGPYRESTKEKAELIAQKKMVVLNGPVDLQAGHAVMTKTCLVCHQFYGEGATPNVGPDLTGVGRSSIDAILANAIDPNQIIGKGYENTIITKKDGELLTGRLIEEDADRVKLLGQGPVEHTITRKQIKSMRTENISVMPEGLEQMPEADFRNLVWYVFSPPQDDKQRKVKVEVNGQKLVIKARRPGSEELTDLFAYSTATGARPGIVEMRDPAGKPLAASVAANLGGAYAKAHFARLLDVQETNDRLSFRALVEIDDRMEEEQEVTVYAMTNPDYYRVDLEWTLRPKTGGELMPAKENGIVANWVGGKIAKWGEVLDIGDGTRGVAIIASPKNINPKLGPVEGADWIGFSPTERIRLTPRKEQTCRVRLLVHVGKLDPKVLLSEEVDLGSLLVGQ